MSCCYVDVDMGYMDVNEDKGDGDVLNNSLKPEVDRWSFIDDEEDERAAVALVASWQVEEAAPNWLRQTKRILPFRNVLFVLSYSPIFEMPCRSNILSVKAAGDYHSFKKNLASQVL